MMSCPKCCKTDSSDCTDPDCAATLPAVQMVASVRSMRLNVILGSFRNASKETVDGSYDELVEYIDAHIRQQVERATADLHAQLDEAKAQFELLDRQSHALRQAAQPSAVASDLDAIRGALARGYCSPENASKVLDSTLIEAMAVEVAVLRSPAASAELPPLPELPEPDDF